MIENVIETTEYCRHCLMCRHVDPVGHVSHNETLTPHGWGQLVASERRGMVSWDEDTVDRIYAFADNGNSRAHCVTSQPLPEAIAAVRAEIVEAGTAPDVVYELQERLREWENPYEDREPGAVEGSGDTALFVGDAARYLRPNVLDAARALLDDLDLDAVPVGRGRNSGFLASSLGLRDVATDIAEANLADLEAAGADRLIVLSPEGKFAFSQMYEERLGVEPPANVEVIELVDLLADRYEEEAGNLPRNGASGAYAYLDPTHAVRLPDRHQAPRTLLESVRGGERKELFWRKERAHPAGNLALEYTHPKLATALTRARLEDAREVGAGTVFTEDASTLHHLTQHSDAGVVKVVSFFEYLAES